MSSSIKKRLDVVLVERGVFDSRSKAQSAVMAGEVLVDGKIADKAGISVREDCGIEIRRKGMEYVSRGGKKLEGALKTLGIDVSGITALDVGASTGGFTDCLLTHGAKRVFALDVGYGLLDEKLRKDSRVTVIERVNIRYVDEDLFDERLDMAVVDVAFISLKHVLPVLKKLKVKKVVALVKPQFEAGRAEVKKGGVVRDAKVQERTVKDIAAFAEELGFEVKGVCESPLKGPKGNREFFLFLIYRN